MDHSSPGRDGQFGKHPIGPIPKHIAIWDQALILILIHQHLGKERILLWVDADGRYHMISHNGDRGQTYAQNASGDCGRHYFSTNGKAGIWRVAPLLPEADLGGCAYPRTVAFDNAEPVSSFTFYRRERPHLIFDCDGVTPVALSTAVIDSPVYGCDRSYTLVQPIKTHNGDLTRTRQENISRYKYYDIHLSTT